MVDWCKKSLAECRRPYGIDHFDLAIAYRVGDSRIRNQCFKGLRPLSLYQGDLDEQLRRRFKDAVVPGGEALIISAAFFSWGEALSHALLQVPGA